MNPPWIEAIPQVVHLIERMYGHRIHALRCVCSGKPEPELEYDVRCIQLRADIRNIGGRIRKEEPHEPALD